MIKVSPSILSADFANLESEMARLKDCGAHWAHVDVMDGHFVPNMSIGAVVVKAISKVSDLPLDVHLMISDPDRYVDDFIKAGSHIITIHEECNSDVMAVLKHIKDAGLKCALSIKPNTPVSALEKYIDILDMVLIMTVEPGFGGQKFIEACLPKIAEARALIDARNPDCLLEIDGGVTCDNVAAAKAAGANVIVAGSSVFGASDMRTAIEILGK
ncbi:MAG: ribulose-phosphate 3-epimerase [Oscillospiraceae bacterium]|nr:ribulose-phosphate 3-epimerase [Oscillospiraceae bacterium]